MKNNFFRKIFTPHAPRQYLVDRLEWNTDMKIPLPIFGLVFTAFMVIFAWIVIAPLDQIANAIARFLVAVNHNNVSFDVLLKAFGVALIVLINMTLTIFFVAVDEPVTTDVLDTLEEMDDRLMDRLAEVSHTSTEKLDQIINEVVMPHESVSADVDH